MTAQTREEILLEHLKRCSLAKQARRLGHVLSALTRRVAVEAPEELGALTEAAAALLRIAKEREE